MRESSHCTPQDEEIRRWLAGRNRSALRIEPLTGDISPRSYFRLQLGSGESAILAVYPPEMGGTYQRFLETTSLLDRISVPTPRILDHDKELRFMLLEDLGRKNLFELNLPSFEEWRPYFDSAVDLAGRIRTLDPARVRLLNPILEPAALEMELDQTWRAYLHPQEMLPNSRSRSRLKKALSNICAEICHATLVPCHRDFMVRNLMPLYPGSDSKGSAPIGQLAVLDHQDLRLGPASYDVASLLNDSLFPPAEIEAELLERSGVSEPDYRRTAIQRTLKAVGTYASFAQRGIPRHLPLIPPTLARAIFHMERLPDLKGLAAFLSRQWAPWLG